MLLETPKKTPSVKSLSHNKLKEDFKHLFCPVGTKDHIVKLRELTNIKLNKNEKGDKFVCSICKKELSIQKIVTLKKCGHTMCKKCLDVFCKKDSLCIECNDEFNQNDIIILQESGTGFSMHNKVETNKLNPYFKF